MRKPLLLIGCYLTTGCAPLVQHGPWVRPGISGSAGASGFLVVGSTDPVEVQGAFNIEGGVRFGMPVNDSSTSGFSFGLQVPLIAIVAAAEGEDDEFNPSRLLHLDGYVATSVRNDLNLGFGLTGSHYHRMPYMQLGGHDRWYTTHAIMVLRENEGWLYAPSFTAISTNGGSSLTHLTLTGGFRPDDPARGWLAGLSIIFEFTRARN